MRNINALTDVDWVATTDGVLTVRETLCGASDIKSLDFSLPALEVGATLRLLSEVFTLAVRHQGVADVAKHKSLNPASVDAAIMQVGSAALLGDPEMPFMQRPVVPVTGPKDTARKLEPGHQPIKKLRPFMASDRAEGFWGLSNTTPDSIPLDRAIPELLMFNYYSGAGNNVYDGDKCAMGAPGLRFLGQDNTATEVIWQGENLWKTLMLNIPASWAAGNGVPAWADRTGTKSFDQKTGLFDPLWSSSWTSNAPACLWIDHELVGVRVGGVPQAWFHPTMGASKEDRKAWWDQRNTQDPRYLYLPNPAGELKAQRLDLERDILDLAIEWNSQGKGETLIAHGASRLLAPSAGDNIVFLRHQIGGTASSPSIRASEVLIGSPERWAPDPAIAQDLRLYSELMSQLHFAVTGPFRRLRASDRSGNRVPAVLDTLEERKADASAYFWRSMETVFEEALSELHRDAEVSDGTLWKSGRDALAVFDSVVEPHRAQVGAQTEFVRAGVEAHIRRRINNYIQEGQV